MKRNAPRVAVLALGALLLSVSLRLVVEAQEPATYTIDSGLITLGWSQILRVTVVASEPATGDPPSPSVVQFRRTTYSNSLCNFGICKRSVLSQVSSEPVLLLPNESTSVDIAYGNPAVRVLVTSNTRDVIINTALIDTQSGNILTLNKERPALVGVEADLSR